jgi:two-component system chemotaxis response regulator CheB
MKGISTKPRRTRVLIVDDSAIMRRVLEGLLKQHTDLEVVGSAPDPFVARDMILELRPDVVTLDIEMPRMNGLSFLKRLMHYRPMPVVVLSSLVNGDVAREALRFGAAEVLGKYGEADSPADLGAELARAIRSAAKRSVSETAALNPPQPWSEDSGLIVIGASTGGVEAIRTVLSALPPQSPPILVVQHIPKGFSAGLAAQLNHVCSLNVKEAGEVEQLTRGQVLLAPGDRHLELRRLDGKLQATLSSAPPLNHHRPSVDVLFYSVAKCAARNVVAVLLTGMGADGAKGLLALREAGARTIAQDKQTSAVYGMPAEAARLGAAQTILPLQDIAGGILGSARNAESKPVAALYT